jgi:hypothetical protein
VGATWRGKVALHLGMGPLHGLCREGEYGLTDIETPHVLIIAASTNPGHRCPRPRGQPSDAQVHQGGGAGSTSCIFGRRGTTGDNFGNTNMSPGP